MKVTKLNIMLVFIVIVLFSGLALPVSATSDNPIFVLGNRTCAELVPGTTEFKVEPVTDGVYGDSVFSVVVDVYSTSDGEVFDFTSNIGVDAVFVKGGENGNLYLYSPEVTSGIGLHAPINDSNKTHFELSHLSFCYDIETETSTPTSTLTSTPTNTSTSTPTSTLTSVPTDTPTSVSTNTPTSIPTSIPTNTPTSTPNPTNLEIGEQPETYGLYLPNISQ